MTHEYKTNVLRQLTGQVVEGTGTNQPIFNTLPSGTDALNDYITEQGYSGTFFLDFSCTRNSQQLLFYTVNREDPGAISQGSFIVITDMDLQPLGIIKQWNSGTDFRVFHKIINNDIGTGRIYFIDIDPTNYDTPRIVYMNDPTSKKVGDEYEAELLSSVYIPNMTSNDYVWDFNKNENASRFAIATFNNSVNKITLTEYVNNVGSTDEWNTYTYNTAIPGFSGDITIYPVWAEKIDCRVSFVDTTNGLDIKVLNTQDNEGTLSLILQKTIQLPNDIQGFTNDIKNVTMLNYNYLYCGSQGSFGYDTTSTFLEVDLNNGAMNILYTTPYYSTFFIQAVNNQIFFIRQSYIPNDNTDEFTFGMVGNHKYYEVPVTTSNNFNPLFFVINSFNLYSIRIIDETASINTAYKLYVIYNSLNYNGNSYNGMESILSNSVVLSDNDNYPIFARNLYNKTVTSNTVESTVEIPAYQLNGIDIAKQQLLSKNNNKIINQSQSIEKNIYEVVLMNFFNTLTIIDNNENKNKVMLNASNYFVNGMESQRYDNIKALKFKVTYTDDSTYIGSIGNTTIDEYTNIATLEFAFYSGVGVSKVEIISNDENVTYATVDETYDTESLYKVTQEVKIGDPLPSVELQYNNEDVNYNGEQVMVYTKEE